MTNSIVQNNEGRLSRYRRFTAEEKTRAVELRAAGLPFAEIARQLGVKGSSLKKMYRRVTGTSRAPGEKRGGDTSSYFRPRRKKAINRLCLRCDRPFKSTVDRLCRNCQTKNGDVVVEPYELGRRVVAPWSY